MNPSALRLAAMGLATAMLLAACGGGGGGNDTGAGQTVPPSQPPQSLGLMKITISGLGTNSMSSHAELLSAPAGSGLQPRAINPMPKGLDVEQIATSHVDVGTRGAGGMRYFNAVYSVRNAEYCPTPGSCTAYTTSHQNLTFIAAATSGNIDNTAVSQLNRFDGSADTASIAQELLPSHGVILNGGGTGVLVQPGYESMQVYSEAEIAAIPLDSGATGLFPYGYVVKNLSSSSSRTLPANPAANQFDGQLAFSFKVPLQTAQTDDPYAVVLIFQVVEDTNTRVTQSAEEQTFAGDAVATARAVALGSTDLAVLGGRVAESNIADPICTVRTAGTAAAPTAWLVDNGNTPTVAGAPYNLQFLAPGGSINAGFCTAMNDASFSTLVVSGSQSGTRTAGGAYTGSYGGGASNRLSFTPDAAHPFFPGELVSFTATTGLSSSTGSLPLSQAFVGSFLAGGSLASSGTFSAAQNVNVGNNPTSVAIGDFDGDGHPDLAVANYSDNTVSILLHSGVAVTPLVIPPPGGPFSIVTADFNGDGHLDLAVADQNGNNVAIFLGNGSGGFGAATTVNVGNSPESIVAGDFNGDGKPDLAVANTADGTLSILTNNGSGGFTVTSTPGTGTGPFAVATGDFNGDGKLDLAVANSGDATVLIMFGTGAGGFNNGGTFSAGAGSSPDSIAVGDFNNDGVLDLAVGDSNDGLVVVMTGPGDGTLPNRTTYSVGSGPSSNPYYVAAGDFNGDGRLDLAVANNADGTVSVLLANDSGGFVNPVNYAVGSTTTPSPYSVYAGDLNGDGRLDLVVANFGESDISTLSGAP